MSLTALFLLAIFPWLFTDHQANDDLRDIWRDNTANSLGNKYHRQGLTFRVGVLVGLGALVTLLNWRDTRVIAWPEFIGYCFYAAGVFAYDFSPRLNRWRMLFFPDYKHLHKWYVSREAGASKWDKFMVRKSAQLGIEPEVLLKRVAWLSLGAGIAAFFVGIILAKNAIFSG